MTFTWTCEKTGLHLISGPGVYSYHIGNYSASTPHSLVGGIRLITHY
ncbi:hypothetical protein FHX49_000642 [Microbacterium endophyticum]|uniref:Uncharacterized protein n=1 Tax=Microbacterium endophyticum TaxID=1526412 RepID=A0A7W4YMW6_9MICO|nr:hypothetical protein [Microbacterium endophyticum]NIK37359.1 hypothetical protein [Microbacterium endophyticum]